MTGRKFNGPLGLQQASGEQDGRLILLRSRETGYLSGPWRKDWPNPLPDGILDGCSPSASWVLDRRSEAHERALRDRMDRCDVESRPRLHKDHPRLRSLLRRDVRRAVP